MGIEPVSGREEIVLPTDGEHCESRWSQEHWESIRGLTEPVGPIGPIGPRKILAGKVRKGAVPPNASGLALTGMPPSAVESY
jgi:hypothetical protein